MLIWIIDEEWKDYDVEKEVLEAKYPGVEIRHSTYDYEKDLKEFGYRADGILAQVYASIPKSTIDRLENCKGIAVYGGGYDRIDVAAARTKNISVTNISGYCAEDLADYLMGNLMGVKAGEEVLIVIDPQTDMRMANAIAGAVSRLGAEYGIYMMPIRGKDKATIFPKSLELGMDACDVFVGMTTASGAAIYNNHLKELINEKKLREVSICLRSIDNFTRGGALADYEKVYADGEKLQKIWRGKKTAHIVTPAGTDLYMEMNQMEPIIECGIARNPGDAMAWSDGEVSLGPVIGTTHGKLVIDGPICYYGCPTIPVELKIEGGRIVEVVGGDPKICKEIRRQIAEVKDSDNIAEIGLGLNPACLFNGDFEEEKKARGTCHIAMGNGFYYGQPARSTVHIDMVQYNPTVIFDEGAPTETLIVKDGKVVCLGDK